MQRFYQQKYVAYQDKFIPLVHTFKSYPESPNLTGVPGEKKDHYKLVAIGNFNESNVEATSRVVKAISNCPEYSLSLYTHVPNLLLQKRGIDTRHIEHKGFVNPEKVIEVLQDYDICLLTHGFTGGYGEIEYQTIFPTRTIPLLLSGKPIIVHSPPGSFLNDFIHENGCGELVDQAREVAIIDGLEKIISDKGYQEKLVDAATKTAQQFYGPEVVRQLQKYLEIPNS